MDAEAAIEYFRSLKDKRPSPSEVDELVAALSRTDGVTRWVEPETGWYSFEGGHEEVDQVADYAQWVLGLHPAETFLPMARAYRGLPPPARARVLRLFEEATSTVWSGMSAKARKTVLGGISGDRDAERIHALLLWHHDLLIAARRRDERAGVRLILEGLRGVYWQSSRAADAASSFSGSESLALAVADAFLKAESASMWVLYGSALAKTGVALPREVVERLVKALENPRSRERQWALLSTLEPYAIPPHRMDDASRDFVIDTLARLCDSGSASSGWCQWAAAALERIAGERPK
jgi:hypothetical protein